MIPLTGEDLLEALKDQGYTIAYNPFSDGDFQFSPLSYFLQMIGVYRSANMSENPNNSEGRQSHTTKLQCNLSMKEIF